MPFLTFQINPFELDPWGSADAQSPSKTNATRMGVTEWQRAVEPFPTLQEGRPEFQRVARTEIVQLGVELVTAVKLADRKSLGIRLKPYS